MVFGSLAVNLGGKIDNAIILPHIKKLNMNMSTEIIKNPIFQFANKGQISIPLSKNFQFNFNAMNSSVYG